MARAKSGGMQMALTGVEACIGSSNLQATSSTQKKQLLVLLLLLLRIAAVASPVRKPVGSATVSPLPACQ